MMNAEPKPLNGAFRHIDSSERRQRCGGGIGRRFTANMGRLEKRIKPCKVQILAHSRAEGKYSVTDGSGGKIANPWHEAMRQVG